VAKLVKNWQKMQKIAFHYRTFILDQVSMDLEPRRNRCFDCIRNILTQRDQINCR
jgi:hypothetical protein